MYHCWTPFDEACERERKAFKNANAADIEYRLAAEELSRLAEVRRLKWAEFHRLETAADLLRFPSGPR